MDSREVTEWQAYDRLSPLDTAWRLEWMLARVGAAICQTFGGRITAEQLQPPWWTAEENTEADGERLARALDALTGAG